MPDTPKDSSGNVSLTTETNPAARTLRSAPGADAAVLAAMERLRRQANDAGDTVNFMRGFAAGIRYLQAQGEAVLQYRQSDQRGGYVPGPLPGDAPEPTTSQETPATEAPASQPVFADEAALRAALRIVYEDEYTVGSSEGYWRGFMAALQAIIDIARQAHRASRARSTVPDSSGTS